MAGPWDEQPTVQDNIEKEFQFRAFQPFFFFSLYMNVGHLLVLALVVWPWMLTLPVVAMIAVGLGGLVVGSISVYNVFMGACVLLWPLTRKTVIGF